MKKLWKLITYTPMLYGILGILWLLSHSSTLASAFTTCVALWCLGILLEVLDTLYKFYGFFLDFLRIYLESVKAQLKH